jgi:uronate dehydrogenase
MLHRHFEGLGWDLRLLDARSSGAIQRLNIDLIANVYEAAVRGSARRLVFASSNWVMAGHRFATGELTTDMAPYPVNPYGISS